MQGWSLTGLTGGSTNTDGSRRTNVVDSLTKGVSRSHRDLPEDTRGRVLVKCVLKSFDSSVHAGSVEV